MIAGLLFTPASNDGNAEFQIASTEFVPGETAVVGVSGGMPGSLHLLFFDLEPGDYWLGGDQWFGLGFSPAFQSLSTKIINRSGVAEIRLPIPQGSAMEGEEFFLQGVSFTGNGFSLSNRIEGSVDVGESGADWLLTGDSFIELATGEKVETPYPINEVYGADHWSSSGKNRPERKTPGDIIELKPGSYRHFRITQSFDRKPGVQTTESWDDVDWGRDPMTIIRAKVPDSVQVTPNTVGGSQTLYLEWSGAVRFENMIFQGDDTSAVQTENPYSKRWTFHQGYRDIEFKDCSIHGGFNFQTGKGPKNKWGCLTYAQGPSTRGKAGWHWDGGLIQGVYDEHANYFHNVQGDILLENMTMRWCGRTAFQMANRINEGAYGKGNLTFRKLYVEDVCIQMGGGGSAFSFNGRHHGRILLDRVKVRLGANPNLAYPWNQNITGSLVIHAGGDTNDLPNGDVIVRDCDFQVGPHFTGKGSARRANIQVRECKSFELSRSRVAQLGDNPRSALDISPDLVEETITLDRGNTIIGTCMFDGVKYDSYAKMLAAIKDHPKVVIK